jgi:uncharacterized protein YbjT (DUF2867 family)
MTTDDVALIVGGTGLVGAHCLRLLVAQDRYAQVIALLRRPVEIDSPRLVQRIVDFDRLDPADVAGATDVYCALGTTIAEAGSKEKFQNIDHGYPAAVAKLTAGAGAKQFILVSAVGADPRSASFYLSVKGRLEQEINAEPFEAVHVLRPSLLLGERGQLRRGEAIGIAAAQTLRFTMKGGLRKYRPIDATTVAAAMIGAALQGVRGRHVYHFDEMTTLAALIIGQA